MMIQLVLEIGSSWKSITLNDNKRGCWLFLFWIGINGCASYCFCLNQCLGESLFYVYLILYVVHFFQNMFSVHNLEFCYHKHFQYTFLLLLNNLSPTFALKCSVSIKNCHLYFCYQILIWCGVAMHQTITKLKKTRGYGYSASSLQIYQEWLAVNYENMMIIYNPHKYINMSVLNLFLINLNNIIV